MPNRFRAVHCENYSTNFDRGFTRFFPRSGARTLVLLNPSMVADTGNKLYEINCRVFVSIEIEINEVSQIMHIVMSVMGIKGLYVAIPPMDPSQYLVQARRVISAKSTSLNFPLLVSAKQRENIDSILVFDPSEISSNSHLTVPIDNILIDLILIRSYGSILFAKDLRNSAFIEQIYLCSKLVDTKIHHVNDRKFTWKSEFTVVHVHRLTNWSSFRNI